jgi:hypothetical protein
LTDDERAELESLVRSTKTEYRTRLKAQAAQSASGSKRKRLKAQIVLMAANGAATRAIALKLGARSA